VVPTRARQIQAGGRPPFKKTVKSPYRSNRLTDFDEIWQGDAGDRPLKFRIVENLRWRRPPSSKITKSLYFRNGLTDLYETLVQNGSVNRPDR